MHLYVEICFVMTIRGNTALVILGIMHILRNHVESFDIQVILQECPHFCCVVCNPHNR